MRNYDIYCYHCQDNRGLSMYAQRVNEKMVGWIFSCKKCAPVGRVNIALSTKVQTFEEEEK